ncbi:hypothetical protein V6Z12_D05G224500 [Gossypium hirsutum]
MADCEGAAHSMADKQQNNWLKASMLRIGGEPFCAK